MTSGFDPEKFTKWIKQKYQEFKGDNVRLKVVDFAKFLENTKSQTISYWLLDKLTKRPSDDLCNMLIRIYGVDAYDALSLSRPSISEVLSRLSPEEAESTMRALAEIKSAGLYKDNASASPEDVKKINYILEKHLGKYHETEQ